MVIGLTGGDLVYFEIDATTGQLIERDKKSFEAEITCLDIAPISEKQTKARFLVT